MSDDAWRHTGLHGKFSRHPRVGMALKAAVAAALAYGLVQPLGGVADDYSYYAPLGAVVALSTAVVGSVRRAVQTMLALCIGASTAVAAGLLPLPEVVSLALVVAIGSVAAGWRVLGPVGAWVPVSALFVLIVGGSDPGYYILGYFGLTAAGIAVGVAVNALLPQVLLTPAGLAADRLREALAGQLDDLADGLSAERFPTHEEWRDRQRELDPLAREARTLVDTAMEARRGNWRARAWRAAADEEYDEARALVRVTTLIEDLTDLISDREATEGRQPALGPALRPEAAQALRATARVLRERAAATNGSEEGDRLVEAASRAVDDLAQALREEGGSTDAGMWAGASLVTSVERILSGLGPHGGPAGAEAPVGRPGRG